MGDFKDLFYGAPLDWLMRDARGAIVWSTLSNLNHLKIGTHTIFLDTNHKRVLNTTYAANCKNRGSRVPSPHHPKR
jgi:hypothetical protein